MGIAEPWALVALLAAAAPLLLHLRSRRAARLVRFPNVELVLSAAREVGRERIVADAWLLIARAGVVALAALAVARPYIGERADASSDTATRGIVVALDRSGAWSSEAALEEARDAAADLLDSGISAGRVVLMPFDDLPGPLFESPVAHRALEDMRPTGRTRSLVPALAAAARVTLSSGAVGPKTVFLLTTPDGAREALAAWTGAARDPNTKLAIYAPTSSFAATRAVTIDEVRLVAASPSAAAERQTRIGVEVRLRWRGRERQAGACEVRLYFDDDPAPAFEETVPATRFTSDGICVVRIDVDRPSPGALLARVEVSASQSPGAQRFIVVPPVDRLRVVCLAGAKLKDAALMRRALDALAGASGSSRAVLPVEVTSAAAEGINASGLVAFDAVAVADVEALGAAEWSELEKFVSAGGALIGAAPAGLPAGARQLFGITSAVRRMTSPGGFGVASSAGLGFLEGVRFTSRLVLGELSSGEAALVFGDGNPALIVRRVGRGRVGLFAAGLGELARRPSVLVPFVDMLLRRVARRPDAPLVLSPSDAPVVVKVDPDSGPLGIELVAPDGRRVEVALVHEPAATDGAFAILPCEGPGLWRLVARTGASAEGRTLRLIGVNPPALKVAESEPRADDSARIVHSRTELLAEVREGGPIELGPVFAFLVLVALAAEIALLESRAHGRAKPPSKGGGK